jgi:anti-repressor protein
MESKQELINSLGEMAVSARELYGFLEVKTQFTKWCERMFEYSFENNKDYFFVSQKRLTAQGNETTFIDYALTLDTSKEISILNNLSF